MSFVLWQPVLQTASSLWDVLRATSVRTAMGQARRKLSAVETVKLTESGLHWVSDGLYLSVSEGGSKSWIFRFMRRGRAREMGLGSFRFVSLAEAREKAWNYRKMIAQGIDPIEARRAEREADQQKREQLVTFMAFAESHIERKKGAWKDPRYAQVWRSQLSHYAYPIIGPMWIQDIQTNKILEILEPIWYTKTKTAILVLNKLEQIFDDAIVQGKYLGQNPARWKKHLEESLPSPARFYRVKHHPAMPYPELPAFMAKLRKSEHIGSPALAILILTLVRIDEARGATWDEIDWDKKIWTIPARRMKGRREGDDDHSVPLSDPALELLQRLKTVCVNDYVFPGEKSDKPIGDHP
jgi:integrase